MAARSEVSNSTDLQVRCDELSGKVKNLKEELKKLVSLFSDTKLVIFGISRECIVPISTLKTGVEKKYNMTKQLCLELEVQIKESENVFEQMESVHSKLKESYETLKETSKKCSADLIKAKSESNELKSLLAFTETKVRMLHFKR